MTGKLYIEFLQQPLSGQQFTYRINHNDDPLVYDLGQDIVDKTFQYETVSATTIGRIARASNDFLNDITFNTGEVGFDSTVYDIAHEPSGSTIYVGGDFKSYNGTAKNKIVRIDDNGDLALFASELNASVRTLCYKTGSGLLNWVYAGGDFTGTGSYPFNRVIKFFSTGEIDISFTQGAGFNSSVNVIKLYPSGDKLIIGGGFTSYNNAFAGRIARLNSNGTLDTAFQNIVKEGFDGDVRDIYVQNDGKMVCVGDFRRYQSFMAPSIARINANGTFDQTFNPSQAGFNLGSSVRTIGYDRDDSTYYFGGSFSTYNGIAQPYIVKTDFNGAIDATYNLLLNNTVNDIEVEKDTQLVTVAGNFITANGDTHQRIVKTDKDAVIESDGTNGFNAPVYVIRPLSGGTFMFGGEFTTTIGATVVAGDIPIGDDMTATKLNTLANLQTWNTSPNVNYVVNGDIIEVYYFTDNEAISYTDIQQIDDYVHIYWELTNEDTAIEVLSRPQDLMPVYNPILVRFGSANYANEQFKYIVDVTNTRTAERIARFKVRPLADGTGYLDISKILSSFTTVDFDPSVEVISDATKSYINFSVDLGEEYLKYWHFDTSAQYGVTGSTQTSVLLESFDTPHNFVIGDLINIVATDTDSTINGLHEVLVVPDLTSIVIDAVYVTGSTDGTAVFADNRNTAFIATNSITGMTAFNGAVSWKDFRNFQSEDYILYEVSPMAARTEMRFLTNLPDNFYMTPTQDIYLDYAIQLFNEVYSGQTKDVKLAWNASNGESGEWTISTDPTDDQLIVRQVEVSPSVIGFDTDTAEWYEVHLTNNDVQISETKRFYIDNRCRIEPYEILFMDRMGSLTSYAFQLRSKETGTISRDMYKAHFDILQTEAGNTYNSYDRGSTINHVDVTKSFELNTNWMTDQMSVYFEELLTSPFTWVKIDGSYYACIVEDKDFETQRQVNQTIIRRTVKITLALQDAINI